MRTIVRMAGMQKTAADLKSMLSQYMALLAPIT